MVCCVDNKMAWGGVADIRGDGSRPWSTGASYSLGVLETHQTVLPETCSPKIKIVFVCKASTLLQLFDHTAPLGPSARCSTLSPTPEWAQGAPRRTRAVGLAGVQLVARAANASVSIWEVHAGAGPTDVGGSGGTSVDAYGRQSKAEVMVGVRTDKGYGVGWGDCKVRAQGPQRTPESLAPFFGWTLPYPC